MKHQKAQLTKKFLSRLQSACVKRVGALSVGITARYGPKPIVITATIKIAGSEHRSHEQYIHRSSSFRLAEP